MWQKEQDLMQNIYEAAQIIGKMKTKTQKSGEFSCSNKAFALSLQPK